jgi:hypothetical protein
MVVVGPGRPFIIEVPFQVCRMMRAMAYCFPCLTAHRSPDRFSSHLGVQFHLVSGNKWQCSYKKGAQCPNLRWNQHVETHQNQPQVHPQGVGPLVIRNWTPWACDTSTTTCKRSWEWILQGVWDSMGFMSKNGGGAFNWALEKYFSWWVNIGVIYWLV